MNTMFFSINLRSMQRSFVLIACALMGAFSVSAQSDIDEGTQTVYYFAWCETVGANPSKLYVTPVSKIVLYSTPDQSIDEYFKRDIERQFTEFLSDRKGTDSLRFGSYQASLKKNTTQDALDAVVKKFKNSGYKIIWVKKFYYD